MSDTGFCVPPHALGRLAPVYTPDGHGGLRRDEQQRDRSTAPAFLSGGGGLVATVSDYARFCQALLNGGALGDVRLLGRKTVELMTANHWSGAEGPLPAGFPGSQTPGAYGFGLGMRALVDVAQSSLLGSAGEYGWGGAQSTYFWIDPCEELVGVFMTQLVPLDLRPAWIFQVLAYQALVD